MIKKLIVLTFYLLSACQSSLSEFIPIEPPENKAVVYLYGNSDTITDGKKEFPLGLDQCYRYVIPPIDRIFWSVYTESFAHLNIKAGDIRYLNCSLGCREVPPQTAQKDLAGCMIEQVP